MPELRPTLPGLVHGIVDRREDATVPAWSSRRYVYTLQCDGCGSTTDAAGATGLILADYTFQRVDGQLQRLCPGCRS